MSGLRAREGVSRVVITSMDSVRLVSAHPLTRSVPATLCSFHTGVNAAGDAGDNPLQYFGWWGRQWEYPHQYYYVRSDIADQY